MAIDVHPRHKPTPEEIIAEQKRVAEARRKARVPAKAAPSVPAVAQPTAPAPLAPDARTPEEYVDSVAPSMFAGPLVRFSKEGTFVIVETEEKIGPDTDFVVPCDEMWVGWIKFGAEGAPPERHGDLLYKDGFTLRPRGDLGDNDMTQWSTGLDGLPEDPWKLENLLVLQNTKTGALYTFATTSQTGRRAVGNLLRHYNRMRRNDSDGYPVVRLRPSGFQSKKKGVGWVHTPSFVVVGRTAKNSAAPPDTSVAADLNDSIPW
jgi:hypothetical protein